MPIGEYVSDDEGDCYPDVPGMSSNIILEYSYMLFQQSLHYCWPPD